MRRRFCFVLLFSTLLTTLAACDSTTASEHVAAGAAHREAGDWRAAIIEFKNALQKAPDLSDARFELGRAHLRMGALEDALAELERAEQLGHDQSELRLPLAEARLATGDPEVIADLLTMFEELPEASLTPGLRAVYAGAEAATGDIDGAVARLDELLREHPDTLLGRMTLARIEIARGNMVSAVGQSEAATEIAPEDERAWLLLGEARLANGDFVTAVDAFEQAREFAVATDIVARIGMARAYLAQNELAQARTLLDEIIELVPQLPQAQYLSALVYLQNEQQDEALDAVQNVLSIAPSHGPSRFLRGLIFLNEGSPERALEDLERVVAQQEGNVRARLSAAAALAQLGQFARAVDLLEDGFSFVEGSALEAGYLAALGQVQLRAGLSSAGMISLSRAVELQPDAAQLRTQLAVAHLVSGDQADAEAELRVAADLNDSFPASRELLILVLLRDEKFDEALTTALAHVEEQPDSPVALNMLGSVHLATEQFEDAEQALRDAIDRDPEFTPAWLNLAGLYAQQERTRDAREALDSVLAYDPVSVPALQRILELAAREENLESARAPIERAVGRAAPSNPQPLLLLVRLEQFLGNDERAYELLRQTDPEQRVDDQVLRARAQIALRTARAQDAVEALTTLRQRNPEDANITAQLALALLRTNDVEQASELVDDAIEDLTDVPTGLLALNVELLIRRGELEQAERRLERLRGQPDTELAVTLLEGDLAAARDDHETAVARYETVLAQAGTTDIVRKLFVSLREVGREADAEARIRDWLTVNPGDVAIRFVLAQHLMDSVRYPEAVTEYEAISEQQPELIIVLNNLAWLYGELDRDEAIPTARRALELAPSAAPVLDTLGWLLAEAQEYREALGLLERAVTGAPEDPEIRYHYAYVLAETGDPDAARLELRTALDAGEFASRSDAQVLLRRLAGS